MGKLIMGCFGDDFTGASDAASFIKKSGLNTILINGVPGEDMIIPDGTEAIVIALKTRTENVSKAVDESHDAYKWLRNKGCEHVYDKYCSTFDSTDEGNIGPIIDYILEKHNIKYTILCPALPVNKRIVKDGLIYVDGVLLAESHMKDHPLTPMTESDIEILMKYQGKYNCLKINYEMLECSNEEILRVIHNFGDDKEHFYVIPDYIDERHSKKIVSLFGDLEFLTGGSGLLAELGKYLKKEDDDCDIGNEFVISSKVYGKGVIFAGSCSKATLTQIDTFIANKGIAIKIEPKRLFMYNNEIERIWDFITEHSNDDVLIYSSGNSQEIEEIQMNFGKEKTSEKIEQCMAELAKRAVDSEYKRIIVAGGETSGAITKKLGFSSYYIGEDIAPGVPIMIPIQNPDTRIVLKSGNFGQKDFFIRALQLTKMID